MASKGCIIPKMLVEAALFLALFAYGKAQSVTCPPLDPLRLTHNPYSINGLQCKWMITVDQYGCRNVLNDCSTGPSPCQNGGEVLWQCSTCEPSCANLSPTCSNHCGPPSCQCAPGLVRDISSGSCIRPDKCRLTQPTPPLPPQCKFGEVLVRQNCSKLTCERQCEGPPNCNQLCNQLLCICAEGYFRASNGECVAQEQCKTARTPCIMDSDCSSGICGDNKFCTQVLGGPSRRNDTEILICGFTGCTNHHCNWDDDCHPGAKCINNRCNRGGCHAWSDCPANTGCIDNQCIAVELRPNFCQTDDHCPGAMIVHRIPYASRAPATGSSPQCEKDYGPTHASPTTNVELTTFVLLTDAKNAAEVIITALIHSDALIRYASSSPTHPRFAAIILIAVLVTIALEACVVQVHLSHNRQMRRSLNEWACVSDRISAQCWQCRTLSISSIDSSSFFPFFVDMTW
uniref:TIL domain-containing protein n=1 Tax=Panagrellus redivivus TaxID=6233 RepID=A0A7E4UVC4_PANRE